MVFWLSGFNSNFNFISLSLSVLYKIPEVHYAMSPHKDTVLAHCVVSVYRWNKRNSIITNIHENHMLTVLTLLNDNGYLVLLKESTNTKP